MTRCTTVALLTSKPETRDELRRILLAQVEPTRAEPGCISYDLHVDETDGCVFMFYENWRSKLDLDAHLKTPHLKPLQSRLNDLLARPPDIRFYEILTASGGS
jgi:quinol monooxygenase YgiN